MKINEFAEKYGLDKRQVDYYTNLGLIHPDGKQTNGYREYGPQAEEEAKLILIIDAMEVRPVDAYVKVLTYLPKKEWKSFVIDKIRQNMERVTEHYRKAIQYATDLSEE